MEKEKKKIRLWEGGIHIDQTATKENLKRVLEIIRINQIPIITREFYLKNIKDKQTEEFDQIPGVSTSIAPME